MSRQVGKNVYQFAYNEASSELRKILVSFEQLQAQKRKIENLIAVLKPEVDGIKQIQERPRSQQKAHLPNCVVVTRLTVL
jgi:hypothetical protein